MSLSGNVVFGNATIAMTAIVKACNRINENTLILQGLSNVIDASGNITDVLLGTAGNSQTLLDSIGQMLDYLVSRGWCSVYAPAPTQVGVRFKMPYNNSLQTSSTLNLFTIALPTRLFFSNATFTNPSGYVSNTAATTAANKWSTNSISTVADEALTYVTALSDMQRDFGNLNDMMTALNVINQ